MSFKVLVLSDNSDFYDGLRWGLEQFCGECKYVRDVDRALGILQSEFIDIVALYGDIGEDSWRIHDVLYCADPKEPLPGIIAFLPKINLGSLENARRFWNGYHVRGIETLSTPPYVPDELLARIKYLLKKAGKSFMTSEEQPLCLERMREKLRPMGKYTDEDIETLYHERLDRVNARAAEMLWTVTFTRDELGVTCNCSPRQSRRVLWSDLRGIYIDTNDKGLLAEDVFLVLADDIGECRIPLATLESAALLRQLQTLPGFDYDAAIQSKTCSDKRRFVCWEKRLTENCSLINRSPLTRSTDHSTSPTPPASTSPPVASDRFRPRSALA
ncbi:hypothetical protein TFLX_02243 [Thermoflexales bacterium]|nr:hypothetical protein TFLX_02243 [Thermoflexales bacterium]